MIGYWLQNNSKTTPFLHVFWQSHIKAKCHEQMKCISIAIQLQFNCNLISESIEKLQLTIVNSFSRKKQLHSMIDIFLKKKHLTTNDWMTMKNDFNWQLTIN